MTLVELSKALGAKVDSVETAARRKSSLFTRVSGKDDGVTRLALVQRRAS